MSSHICYCSVTQSYPTLCDPVDYSTPGFRTLHRLPELAQTHVRWVIDAIQPSHPLCPLLLPPSIFPSIKVFSDESALHIRSVQFSRSVMAVSWRSHGRQHSRPPCPLPTPGVYSNPCPLCRWWHPTILSLVIPFSSHLQSFPASGSFQMS